MQKLCLPVGLGVGWPVGSPIFPSYVCWLEKSGVFGFPRRLRVLRDGGDAAPLLPWARVRSLHHPSPAAGIPMSWISGNRPGSCRGDAASWKRGEGGRATASCGILLLNSLPWDEINSGFESDGVCSPPLPDLQAETTRQLPHCVNGAANSRSDWERHGGGIRSLPTPRAWVKFLRTFCTVLLLLPKDVIPQLGR